MNGQNLFVNMHQVHKARKVRRKQRKRTRRLLLFVMSTAIILTAFISSTWFSDSHEESVEASETVEINEQSESIVEPSDQEKNTEHYSENELQNTPVNTDSSFHAEAVVTDYETPESEDTFLFPDSDTRILTDEDLQGLDKYTVQLAINEICAREGRMFNKSEWRSYFESFDWYTPRVEPEVFDENIDTYLGRGTVARYNYELLCKYRASM